MTFAAEPATWTPCVAIRKHDHPLRILYAVEFKFPFLLSTLVIRSFRNTLAFAPETACLSFRFDFIYYMSSIRSRLCVSFLRCNL
jgi:hypothetical protein